MRVGADVWLLAHGAPVACPRARSRWCRWVSRSCRSACAGSRAAGWSRRCGPLRPAVSRRDLLRRRHVRRHLRRPRSAWGRPRGGVAGGTPDGGAGGAGWRGGRGARGRPRQPRLLAAGRAAVAAGAAGSDGRPGTLSAGWLAVSAVLGVARWSPGGTGWTSTPRWTPGPAGTSAWCCCSWPCCRSSSCGRAPGWPAGLLGRGRHVGQPRSDRPGPAAGPAGLGVLPEPGSPGAGAGLVVLVVVAVGAVAGVRVVRGRQGAPVLGTLLDLSRWRP